MPQFPSLRYLLLAVLMMVAVVGCNLASGPPFPTSSARPTPEVQQSDTPNQAIAAVDSTGGQAGIFTDPAGLIRVEPLPIDPALRNEWTPELEEGFWQRANQVIQHFANRGYGNTHGENEKRSYPFAMYDFLAGNREQALEFLQSEDNQGEEHEHTEGIDYYFSFTLKGQIRKYFFFGQWLDPDYRERMFAGAKRWTAEDPTTRPHPLYGEGSGEGNEWTVQRRGYWVDRRNTDNLRAMREVAVYLMAEETGNEATRDRYKEKLQRYVWALYNIGMGEWDSETYHGHTFAAYLNLYDFAKDPEVKRLGKAALDWLSASAALKYYHGGWGAPSKRDDGGGNVVLQADAARFFWIYFGDTPAPNESPERDIIHAITSAYRPPLAVMALAHKQFDRPVELINTKPTYENWKPGGEDAPVYWETLFLGHTYQMGSVVSSFADGDVGSFRLMADNSDRGVDCFVVNTGDEWVESGKREGDQIGQFRNSLIWLSPAVGQPFAFQLPKTAQTEIDSDIWFFQLEDTWLALHPINLQPYQSVEPNEDQQEDYPNEQGLKSRAQGNGYAGFVLEVGEPQSHRSYADFKRSIKNRSRLNLSALNQGNVTYTNSTRETLELTYNRENDLPTVTRNGDRYDWASHYDLYRPTEGDLISLGWKQGTLRVNTGGHRFETTVGGDRLVR
ncbi:hypothetical protein H6G89_15675 [Oscillatoria sp. FACHB-1407]|uniref:hypothetical protein n=1 Tax=Oscillatoria sp. FACHB-1407 TaxID=2692847 RepID=UPI0016890C13|nr:hypothetical protein [Oscillatoria sp. FACHB-1407]MBD2462485.1 hypothetical protein [Oscillatoria sp. FACHB-1407]